MIHSKSGYMDFSRQTRRGEKRIGSVSLSVRRETRVEFSTEKTIDGVRSRSILRTQLNGYARRGSYSSGVGDSFICKREKILPINFLLNPEYLFKFISLP